MSRADIVVYNAKLVRFPKKPLRRVNREYAGIVDSGGLAIKEGKIVAIGESNDIRLKYAGECVINADGRLVTPGLVDPHTHLVFAGSREDEFEMKLLGVSYVEILKRGGGIYRTVAMTQRATLQQLVAGAVKTLKIMLDHGTTVVEAKSGYGLKLEYEIKQLKASMLASKNLPIRIVNTLLAHVVPPDYLDKRGSYVEYFKSIIDEVRRQRLAKYVDVFCDVGAFTPMETLELIRYGLRRGLRARIHADQLGYIGCSDLASRVYLDSVDHLEKMPAKNARLLATTGTVAVLTPTSMLAMFEKSRPPVDHLRREGVPIAVASDYNPNNMTPTQQLAMDIATYLLGLTPLEALAAATVNAAWSLRISGGRLVEGEPADVLIWDLEDYKWIGYTWGYNKVLTVISKGIIYKNRLDGCDYVIPNNLSSAP